MRVNRIVNILCAILPLYCVAVASAADGFSRVRCGGDIQQALIGQTMTNERVSLTESRHKDLGLADLGATEISDRLLVISWKICGDEYMLLQQKDIVRDVLKFPPHSKDSPQFIGSCENDKGPVSGTIVAVLQNEKGDLLPVKTAWSIDEKQAKFVTIKDPEELRCPRDGISTPDQGQD